MTDRPRQEVLPPEDPDEPGDDPPPLPHERPWPFIWQGPFLAALMNTGNVTLAHRRVRIGHTRVYQVRNEQPDFAAAWDEAKQLSLDVVEANLRRWGTEGLQVEEVTTVEKVDATGQVVSRTTTTRRYAERSVAALIFWLKANVPEKYRWSEKLEHTGADGRPIQVESLDAIDRQIAQLEQELAARALPAGDAPSVNGDLREP